MCKSNETVSSPYQQRGVALLALLTLLSLFGLYLFVGQLSATQFQLAREEKSAAALAEARQALIDEAVTRVSINDAGYLRLPDLGVNVGAPAEGYASGTFADDGKDLSVIGKFPWKTLDTGPLRDSKGQCLWYVVSGRFKKDTDLLKTDVFNWDTLGQVDVINANGAFLAVNLAALLVSPGPALDGQSRALADAAAYTECGGNYDARNYLDAFDGTNALAGQVNYYADSTNNRVASDSNNKQFVMVANYPHYNDRFTFLSVGQIFDPLIRRRDFWDAIGNLLDDVTFRAHLQTIVVAGNKGTDNLLCTSATGADNQGFCKNWKEMLLLTELPAPAMIRINGAPSGPCTRVLIFAGRRTAGQSRSTSIEKANPANYLEGANATSFHVPTASATDFAGASVFNWRTPATDLLRCLP
mgnify:CR=1 FL=1